MYYQEHREGVLTLCNETSLGIYDYKARFYSPRLGRFLSPDTLIPDPANPQDMNRLAYTRNNSLRYTDPTGHKVDPDGVSRVPFEILWDDEPRTVNEHDRLAAERAFLHYLRDPQYFVALYADPEAWKSSEETAALQVFSENSVLHMSADDLVRPYIADPEVHARLLAAHLRYGAGDEAGSRELVLQAGSIALGVSVQDLIKAAEERYPNKVGRKEWHHYKPKYLGGDPKGVQYQIPAAYHQYITNEFRQLWGYKNPLGRPDPQTLQWIMDHVYGRYPIPSDAERR